MMLSQFMILLVSLFIQFRIVKLDLLEEDTEAWEMAMQIRDKKYLVRGTIAWKMNDGKPSPVLRKNFHDRAKGECFIVLQKRGLQLFYWCNGVCTYNSGCRVQMNDDLAEYTMRLSMLIHQKVHYTIEIPGYESEQFKFFFLNGNISKRNLCLARNVDKTLFVLVVNGIHGSIHIRRELITVYWIRLNVCLVIPIPERGNAYGFCGTDVSNNQLKETTKNLCTEVSKEMNLNCIILDDTEVINMREPELEPRMKEIYNIFGYADTNDLPPAESKIHEPLYTSFFTNEPISICHIPDPFSVAYTDEKGFVLPFNCCTKPLSKRSLNTAGCAILHTLHYLHPFEILMLWIGKKTSPKVRRGCTLVLNETINRANRSSKLLDINHAIVVEEGNETVEFKIRLTDFFLTS